MGFEGAKILIVDDEKDLAEAISTALSYEGYQTLKAHDGEEGLKMALEEKPDLIFLDIMMPKMDGIAVLKALKEDEWGRTAKVIIMTVLDDMDKIAEVTEQGGEGYILKSDITLEKIVEKTKETLG